MRRRRPWLAGPAPCTARRNRWPRGHGSPSASRNSCWRWPFGERRAERRECQGEATEPTGRSGLAPGGWRVGPVRPSRIRGGHPAQRRPAVSSPTSRRRELHATTRHARESPLPCLLVERRRADPGAHASSLGRNEYWVMLSGAGEPPPARHPGVRHDSGGLQAQTPCRTGISGAQASLAFRVYPGAWGNRLNRAVMPEGGFRSCGRS